MSAEELVSLCREAIEVGRQLGAAAKLWQGRYRRLLRRAQRALDKVRDIAAELESADSDDPHVRAALEIVYEVERLLSGVVEG
ncbi:MAG: hypothetical protein LM580_12380 [Thermofilum sp.]|nr:hypothetical protein [Thermofilum sp.]